jgi:uncharacterized protein YndB with AHSA1/START domain
MTTTTVSDRIEKRVLLRAPLGRVWRALTDSGEFGTWFGATMQGPFAEGATVRGQITYPGYEHLTMDITIERIEPQRYFSYRWHPNAVDPKHDYSSEPTTLVEFRLQEVAGGTELTIVESGFDRIPLERRADAFRSNDGGWTEQTRRIDQYVAKA